MNFEDFDERNCFEDVTRSKTGCASSRSRYPYQTQFAVSRRYWDVPIALNLIYVVSRKCAAGSIRQASILDFLISNFPDL